MNYVIKIGKEFNIKNHVSFVEITVKSFSSLIDLDYKKIIENVVIKDEIFKFMNFSDEIINLLLDYIINERNEQDVISQLDLINLPLYSIILNTANSYKRKYKSLLMLKEANQIILRCNKDNLLEAMSIIPFLNVPIVIDSTNISLEDYRHIMSNFDFNNIEKYNIKVNYQKNNTYITPRELYDVSLLICNISEEIKKYNLSSLEQIMYAYDIVKNRKYKECESNKRNSRDLDKVLLGDTIVCVGYSNFFNAILKSLDISAMPLIDIKKHHQCSLVYIKDFKYNVDGVYVFDPTGDRKRADGETYIGNYKFFATPVNLKDNEIFGDILKVLCMDFDSIVKVISSDNVVYSGKLLNNLEELCKLIGNNSFNDLSFDINLYKTYNKKERERVITTYMKFLSKFNSEEISLENFVRILYNTRRVQYYNNIITDFNTEDIFKAVYDRFTYLQKLKVKKEETDDIIYLLKTHFYRDRIADNLLNKGDVIIESSLQEGLDISRDKENIKLLKVLRNRQKQLTEERK